MTENGKQGFFSALWGVCCGTAIFPRLLGNSRARAVWHLFLMSLVCTVLLSLQKFPAIRDEWNSFAKRYIAVFGRQVEFSEAGIRPELDPDKPRSMELPRSGTLIYTAREQSITIPPGALSTSDYLVMWSSHFFVLAVRMNKDKELWDVQLMRPRQDAERQRLDRAALAGFFDEELKRPPDTNFKWSLYDFQLAAAELFSLAGYCHSAVWFVSDWLVSFVLGLLCTGLFALLARVTGAATARGLAGWQYWQVGVYAGFPGMLIGTAAAALELPVLSYGTAYVLALVIYWLPAAAACSTDDGVRRPPDAGGTPGK